MAPRKSTAQTVYQLKITLKDVKPPVWRRVQVLNDMSLFHLHHFIQLVMGWTDSHLHQFTIAGVEYSQPLPEYEFNVRNEATVKLSKVVPGEKFKFLYTYDMGDCWEHEILVEKVLPREAEQMYPICLAGKRACPPEDCGGAWGYAEFVEAIQNPDHPDHAQMLEWVGGAFDPNEFDRDEINQHIEIVSRTSK
jgi:hypothetical protein